VGPSEKDGRGLPCLFCVRRPEFERRQFKQLGRGMQATRRIGTLSLQGGPMRQHCSGAGLSADKPVWSLRTRAFRM